MKLGIRIIGSVALVITACIACKKSVDISGTNPGGISIYPAKTDSVYSPVDPAVAATIGFFQNAWVARTFVSPDTVAGAVPTGPSSDSLTINLNSVVTKVSPYLYGNNSVLWMGQMVTQPTLMQYIKDLSPNIIRAPAGSVSDVYFFNGTMANRAPADAPVNIVDGATSKPTALNPWYGGNTDNGTLTLSNYYQVLSQTKSTGIITINYGYARYSTAANPVAAAAHLAADWVRYDNGRTKFWEIGNETYGSWEAGYEIDTTKNKDGQPRIVTGALYGKHLSVFADSMRAAAKQLGATIYIGATLFNSPPASYDVSAVRLWNQGVLTAGGNTPDYFIVHDYFTGYATNSTVQQILSTGTTEAPTVMSFIQSQLKQYSIPIKPIAMTEWNIQATGSKQNVSYIAGMHAAKTLGSFIKSQYGEASRWDLANGYDKGDDQGLFNVGDEPTAPLWNPRPAFFYMYYFQKYFGDRMVSDTLRKALNNADLTTYSSTFSSGQASTVIINSGAFNHIVSIDFQHFPAGSKYYWVVLTGGSDNAPFSGQVYVNGTGPATPTGGPLNYATIKPYSAALKGSIKVSVPAMSVVYLVADKK